MICKANIRKFTTKKAHFVFFGFFGDISIKDRENFWKKIADNIFWYKKPTKILNSKTHLFTSGTKMVQQILATMQ